MNFINSMREYISQGHTEHALEQLISYLHGVGSRSLNEIILYSNRFANICKDQRIGVVADTEAERRKNQITLGILDLLSALEHDHTELPFPPGSSPVSVDPKIDFAQEKIFGISHLRKIAWLQMGLEVARAVCRVTTPHALGTGFLIGGGMIITNHHVITSEEEASRSYVDFNFEEDITGNMHPTTRYTVKKETYRCSEAMDVCCMELKQQSHLPRLDNWGSVLFNTETLPKAGDHVSIIQHPQGGPKQVAITGNQVVNLYGHRLHYLTDTLPGSSGSPVFGDDWRICAVHRGGGNLIMNDMGQKGFANEGILSKFVVETLNLPTNLG